MDETAHPGINEGKVVMSQTKKLHVLVTGASRGLGRALSERLALRGASVVMVARHEGPLLEAVAEVRSKGGDAHALVADVSSDPARIVGAAVAMTGPIDVVVHNASTLGPVPLRPLAETSDEDFLRALEVNLVAPFAISRALVGSMIQRGAGLLVHISSDASVEAYPEWGAYAVSKAGIDHLSRIWAAELEGTGVRAVAVDPGEMDTVMHAEAIPDADPTELASPATVAERIARLIEDASAAPSGARLSASELGEAVA